MYGQTESYKRLESNGMTDSLALRGTCKTRDRGQHGDLLKGKMTKMTLEVGMDFTVASQNPVHL
jgi:hypothetical protein